MDVGEDTTGGNGNSTEQLVQLFVVADGELNVTRDNALLLVITGGVASEFQDLSGQVLEDGSEVHWRTSTDAGGVATDAQVTMDAAHWELEPSLRRTGGRFACLLSSSHDM